MRRAQIALSDLSSGGDDFPQGTLVGFKGKRLRLNSKDAGKLCADNCGIGPKGGGGRPFHRIHCKSNTGKVNKFCKKTANFFLSGISPVPAQVHRRFSSRLLLFQSAVKPEMYWYANAIASLVNVSHRCGGSFSEKPVGRNMAHRREPNAFSKADA